MASLDIQAIAAKIQQDVPQGEKADFGEMVDISSQLFYAMTPSHSQEVREAWVAAATWVLSILITSMKEQQPLSAKELAMVVKLNLSAMVVAIAADEVKASDFMRERLQAALDASQSFWEE